MTVDIFSDIRCPFCYVGKKKFEKALDKFAKRDDIKVVWHSYQLDPYLQTQPDRDPYDFFSESKGINLQQAKMMHEHAKKPVKKRELNLILTIKKLQTHTEVTFSFS